jgi:hypothetical protein
MDSADADGMGWRSRTVWATEMRSQPIEVALSGVEVVERDILLVMGSSFEW